MSIKKPSPRFIIGSRHLGLTLLTSIKAYSSILQKDVLGEISDTNREALKVIIDCCETSWECWSTLTEIIEQNEEDQILDILYQADKSGKSYLERNFIQKSIASLEIAKKEANRILEQAQKLTDEQNRFVTMIGKNCEHEINVWKEIASYFS